MSGESAHYVFREGGDGQRRVDAEVGADHRTVHHVEPLVAENPARRVDDAVIRIGADSTSSEDVRSRRGVQQHLVETGLGDGVKLGCDLPSHPI